MGWARSSDGENKIHTDFCWEYLFQSDHFEDWDRGRVIIFIRGRDCQTRGLPVSDIRTWIYLTSRDETGGGMVVRNVCILTQHYIVSQPRRPRAETPPSWKPQNSHHEYITSCGSDMKQNVLTDLNKFTEVLC